MKDCEIQKMKCLILILGTVLELAPLSYARDYSPLLDFEPYWADHFICSVEVASAKRLPNGEFRLTFAVHDRFNAGPDDAAAIPAVPATKLWFDTHRREKLAVKDRLILYMSRSGDEPIVVTKLDSSFEDSPIIRDLQRIARQRREPGNVSLIVDGLSCSEVVSKYALTQFESKPSLIKMADNKRLNNLRDDVNVNINVRIRLSRVMALAINDPEEHHRWLNTMLKGPAMSPQDMHELLLDLCAFAIRNADDAILIVSMGSNKDSPRARRLVCYAVAQERLFDIKHPRDKLATSVIDMYVLGLSDGDAYIRGDAADKLSLVAASIADVENRRLVGMRLAKMIENSMDAESDAVAKFEMRHGLERLSASLAE